MVKLLQKIGLYSAVNGWFHRSETPFTLPINTDHTFVTSQRKIGSKVLLYMGQDGDF